MAIKVDPEKLVAVDHLREVARGLWDEAKAAQALARQADEEAQDALDKAIGLTGHVLSFTQKVSGYRRGGPTDRSRRLLVQQVRLVRKGLQAQGPSVDKHGEVGTMILECLLDHADDLGTLEQFKGAK